MRRFRYVAVAGTVATMAFLQAPSAYAANTVPLYEPYTVNVSATNALNGNASDLLISTDTGNYKVSNNSKIPGVSNLLIDGHTFRWAPDASGYGSDPFNKSLQLGAVNPTGPDPALSVATYGSTGSPAPHPYTVLVPHSSVAASVVNHVVTNGGGLSDTCIPNSVGAPNTSIILGAIVSNVSPGVDALVLVDEALGGPVDAAACSAGATIVFPQPGYMGDLVGNVSGEINLVNYPASSTPTQCLVPNGPALTSAMTISQTTATVSTINFAQLVNGVTPFPIFAHIEKEDVKITAAAPPSAGHVVLTIVRAQNSTLAATHVVGKQVTVDEPSLLTSFNLPILWTGTAATPSPLPAPLKSVSTLNIVSPAPSPLGMQAPSIEIPVPTAEDPSPIGAELNATASNGATIAAQPQVAASEANVGGHDHYFSSTFLPFSLLGSYLCPGTPFPVAFDLYGHSVHYGLEPTSGVPDPTTYTTGAVVGANDVPVPAYAPASPALPVSAPIVCDEFTPSAPPFLASCNFLLAGGNGVGGAALLTIPGTSPKPPIVVTQTAGTGPVKVTVLMQNTDKQDYETVSLPQTNLDICKGSAPGSPTPADQYTCPSGSSILNGPATIGLAGVPTTTLKPGGSIAEVFQTAPITSGQAFYVLACATAPEAVLQPTFAGNCTDLNVTKS